MAEEIIGNEISISSKNAKKLKNLKLIIFALIIVQMLGIAAYLIFFKEDVSYGNDSDSSFIPIWVAVFIPLIVANSKNKADMTF